MGRNTVCFRRLGPGEIFGEMAVIENLPRSATAIAVRDTQVYFIPRDEMLALLKRSPGLAFNLLQEISRRLRDFNELHLREVVQAERLAVVGNFARSILHDLKNPLSVISLAGRDAGPARPRPGETCAIARLHPQTGRAHQRNDRRYP